MRNFEVNLHLCMNNQLNECAVIGNCKINCLLFANDLVLLSSTESGLQRTLPHPHLWSWVLGNDQKNTITSASV